MRTGESNAVEPRDEARIAAELVRRIRHGDVAAEGAMVERYSGGLLAFLHRRTGDPALAEDLHQEAFRIILVRLRESGLAEPEKLASFLHSTARNLAVAHFRKTSRRRTENVERGGEAGVPADQVDRVRRRDRASVVRRLLAELEPRRDRELLFRFYILEDEKEQICADLNLSTGHFKRVLHRARRRFKALLEGFDKQQRIEVAAVSLHPESGRRDRVEGSSERVSDLVSGSSGSD